MGDSKKEFIKLLESQEQEAYELHRRKANQQHRHDYFAGMHQQDHGPYLDAVRTVCSILKKRDAGEMPEYLSNDGRSEDSRDGQGGSVSLKKPDASVTNIRDLAWGGESPGRPVDATPTPGALTLNLECDSERLDLLSDELRKVSLQPLSQENSPTSDAAPLQQNSEPSLTSRSSRSLDRGVLTETLESPEKVMSGDVLPQDVCLSVGGASRLYSRDGGVVLEQTTVQHPIRGSTADSAGISINIQPVVQGSRQDSADAGQQSVRQSFSSGQSGLQLVPLSSASFHVPLAERLMDASTEDMLSTDLQSTLDALSSVEGADIADHDAYSQNEVDATLDPFIAGGSITTATDELSLEASKTRHIKSSEAIDCKPQLAEQAECAAGSEVAPASDATETERELDSPHEIGGASVIPSEESEAVRTSGLNEAAGGTADEGEQDANPSDMDAASSPIESPELGPRSETTDGRLFAERQEEDIGSDATLKQDSTHSFHPSDVEAVELQEGAPYSGREASAENDDQRILYSPTPVAAESPSTDDLSPLILSGRFDALQSIRSGAFSRRTFSSEFGVSSQRSRNFSDPPPVDESVVIEPILQSIRSGVFGRRTFSSEFGFASQRSRNFSDPPPVDESIVIEPFSRGMSHDDIHDVAVVDEDGYVSSEATTLVVQSEGDFSDRENMDDAGEEVAEGSASEEEVDVESSGEQHEDEGTAEPTKDEGVAKDSSSRSFGMMMPSLSSIEHGSDLESNLDTYSSRGMHMDSIDEVAEEEIEAEEEEPQEQECLNSEAEQSDALSSDFDENVSEQGSEDGADTDDEDSALTHESQAAAAKQKKLRKAASKCTGKDEEPGENEAGSSHDLSAEESREYQQDQNSPRSDNNDLDDNLDSSSVNSMDTEGMDNSVNNTENPPDGEGDTNAEDQESTSYASYIMRMF